MTVFDELKPGARQISSKAFNEATEGGELARKARILGGLQRQIPGGGSLLDLSTIEGLRELLGPTPMTVIVKKAPSVVAGAGWITVQRIQYKDQPPLPCSDTVCNIAVIGDEFEARPDHFTPVSRYTSFEITDVANMGPSHSTFTVRWEDDKWILSAPPAGGGSTMEHCLVHAPLAGTNWNVDADYIRVIKMIENPAYTVGSGLPTHIIKSNTSVIVKCWPGTKQADWQYFQGTNQGFPPIVLTNAPYFATKTTNNGVVYITPEAFVEAGLPDTGTTAGDC